jgi:hypothetical protein
LRRRGSHPPAFESGRVGYNLLMIQTIRRELFSAFIFSGILILTYYLRSNGFRSAVIALSVYLILLFAYLVGLKIRAIDLILGPAFIGVLSLPYASRGPSFADSLFILSFAAPIHSLLFSINRNRENRRAVTGYTLLSFLAPLSVWCFSANWEFPSTFSPFLIYGAKEIPWIAASVILAFLFFRFERKRYNALLVSLSLNILFLILIERLDSRVLRDMFPFGLENSIFLLVSFGIFFLIFLERLNSYIEKSKADEGLKLDAARFVILIPVFITLIFVFSYNLRSSLPIPFSTVKISAALVFAVCSYGLTLLNWKVKGLNYPLVFILLVLFILRLFLPAESNNINHFGEVYSFYSLGFEHLGIWAVFLILFIALFLKFDQKVLSSVFLLGSSLSLIELYYSRLYHFITWIPVQVFKDLGAEGVSWVRKAIYSGENIALPVLVSIIIILRNLAKNEADI